MIKKIIILIVIWVIYLFTDYFYLSYFIQPISWLLVCLILLILTIRQIKKSINQRKNLSKNRILNISVTSILFILTFYNFNKIPRSFIEKIDWTISYNKRCQIVKEVEDEKLKPNTEMKNGICKLQFDFPIISNGGNDIWIENKNGNKIIKFWISRRFFDSPQTYFIYSKDAETKKHYQELIKSKPKNNWLLEENWYRITERD